MTNLSTRYAGPLVALLLPACFAVWVHSYDGFRSDDCADSSAMLEPGWMGEVERTEEPDAARLPWLLQDIGGTVATEAPHVSPLEFRILRSFELERLYETPLEFIPGSRDFLAFEPTLEWIDSRGEELPVHEIVVHGAGEARIGAYMFVYDSRPMATPSLDLFFAAFRRAATGRRPLTLLTVSAAFSTSRREVAEELAEEWLASAWEHYRSVCRR